MRQYRGVVSASNAQDAVEMLWSADDTLESRFRLRDAHNPARSTWLDISRLGDGCVMSYMCTFMPCRACPQVHLLPRAGLHW